MGPVISIRRTFMTAMHSFKSIATTTVERLFHLNTLEFDLVEQGSGSHVKGVVGRGCRGYILVYIEECVL